MRVRVNMCSYMFVSRVVYEGTPILRRQKVVVRKNESRRF